MSRLLRLPVELGYVLVNPVHVVSVRDNGTMVNIDDDNRPLLRIGLSDGSTVYTVGISMSDIVRALAL